MTVSYKDLEFQLCGDSPPPGTREYTLRQMLLASDPGRSEFDRQINMQFAQISATLEAAEEISAVAVNTSTL